MAAALLLAGARTAGAQNAISVVGPDRTIDLGQVVFLEVVIDFSDLTVGCGLSFDFDDAILTDRIEVIRFDPEATLGDDLDFRCPGSEVVQCPTADANFLSFGGLEEEPTEGIQGRHVVALVMHDTLASGTTAITPQVVNDCSDGVGEVIVPDRVPATVTVGVCFYLDTLCDEKINILDVQAVLNQFGNSQGQPGFDPDLDVVPEGEINILDAQAVLNRFGETAPFLF